jgi:hypothetical protein
VAQCESKGKAIRLPFFALSMYSHLMLEDALAILALYILSLSTTVVSFMLSEEGDGCSKDGFIAAL